MSTEQTDSKYPPERRRATRIPRRESVSIELMLPSPEPSQGPEVVATETLDVSATGIRVTLGKVLDSGYILDFCVDLHDNPRRFLLAGETRWCQFNSESGRYEVGILIHDAEGTDSDQWFALFADGDD